MQDVSHADHNQILLSVHLQSLHPVNIHVCQNLQRKPLPQVSIWNLWNPTQILCSLETGKSDIHCETGVAGEDGHGPGCTAENHFLQPRESGDCSQDIWLTCQVRITCLFHTVFSWCEPLSTIISVSEYLARAWHSVLHLRNKTAKSVGDMKKVAAGHCAHRTFSAWFSALPYSGDNRGSKCGLWIRNIFTQLC